DVCSSDLVALDPADGHEGPERIEQVLAEMRAGNRVTNPLHVTPMEIWVRIGRLEAVGPTDLADLDRTLPLQGQDHPVTRLDLVSKRPDLAGPVLDGSGFGFWIVLLQRQDQALAVTDL